MIVTLFSMKLVPPFWHIPGGPGTLIFAAVVDVGGSWHDLPII